jgi:hypothetical protein
MTKQQHSIIPATELVKGWFKEWHIISSQSYTDRDIYIATRAAQWGADQELEACCEWLETILEPSWCDKLRTARRPKPPSLKQQVLATLQYPKDLWSEDEVDAIRRLVEQLDD